MKDFENKNRRISPVSVIGRVFGVILKVLFALVILAFQLAAIYFTVFYPMNQPWITTVNGILAFVAACYVYWNDQNTSYKILWLVVIIVLPIAGTTLYLLYGCGKSAPKKRQKKADDLYLPLVPQNDVIRSMKSPAARKAASAVKTQSGFPCYKGVDVKYFGDGKPLHLDMLSELEKAEKYILIETFIVADGRVWQEISEILMRKADCGVKVYIIFDSFGSFGRLSSKSLKKLYGYKNIKIVGFNPINLKLTPSLNHRDHRKLIIIDGKTAYTGGINLADEYVHYIEKYGFWRDMGVRIKGEPLVSYVILFCQNWFMATKKLLDPNEFLTENYPNGENNYVMPFGDTPADEKNPAYNCCMSLIENAVDKLYISTPYLIIDQEMISALCRAAASGVDVRILTPGIPDKKIVYLVTRGHYGRLLASNVKIYEYTPGFNHSKMILADGKHALVGSINLDYRSLLLHYETGTLISNDSCTEEMNGDFLKALELSREITEEEYKKRPIYIKALQYFLSLIAPLL